MATKRTCSIEGCGRAFYARSWCPAHYQRWRKYGDPTGLAPLVPRRVCSIAGCERPSSARGWCRRHYGRWQRTGTPTPAETTWQERFWAKVDKAGPVPALFWDPATRTYRHQPEVGRCWLWTAHVDDKGYGRCRTGKATGRSHRVAYGTVVGPVPRGLVLDHLCLTTRCVNPTHLEPVSIQENAARGRPNRARLNGAKTHCIWGHEFTVENTRVRYRRGRPTRECRRCRAERSPSGTAGRAATPGGP